VQHALQPTYYDKSTGVLSLVKAPTNVYNSTTNTYTTTGSYSKGDAVPSSAINGIRFFKTSNGDAGQTESTYLAVVNGKIVKVSLKHVGYMGDPAKDPSTIDSDKVFDEFANNMKALTVEKQ